MIEDKYMVVSGLRVKLNPYTEKGFKALQAISDEQDKFIHDNPGIKYADIPKSKRAEWFRRKAEVMWTPDTDKGEFPKDFFLSDEFEVGRLRDTENFFVSHVTYL